MFAVWKKTNRVLAQLYDGACDLDTKLVQQTDNLTITNAEE